MGCIQLSVFAALMIFITANRSAGQDNIKKYVTGNTIALSVIDPDSGVDAGLEAVGNRIGDARIVLLGEQDHGDAPVFLAKTRLIKYLHEKKGFNVLAFEGDFFGLNLGWDRLPKEEPLIDSFIRGNVYPIWTACHTCQELFYSYIPNSFRTGNPLHLSGVDNQLMLYYSARHLTGYLDSVLRDLQLPIVKDPVYTSEVLPLIDSLRKWYVQPKDTLQMAKCAAWLDTISEQAGMRLKKEDIRMMVIRNLVEELREYRNSKAGTQAMNGPRDRQMGRNLSWLADVKYAGQKIIVWAANVHIAQLAGNFPGMSYDSQPSLGDEFLSAGAHRGETYIMGFTSFEGMAGRLGKNAYEVKKPRAGAFERWIDPSLNYAFVDFRTYNGMNPDGKERFSLSGFGHIGADGIWNRVFDGVMYIKDIYPCELSK
jgi:erythromycin esterase